MRNDTAALVGGRVSFDQKTKSALARRTQDEFGYAGSNIETRLTLH